MGDCACNKFSNPIENEFMSRDSHQLVLPPMSAHLCRNQYVLNDLEKIIIAYKSKLSWSSGSDSSFCGAQFHVQGRSCFQVLNETAQLSPPRKTHFSSSEWNSNSVGGSIRNMLGSLRKRAIWKVFDSIAWRHFGERKWRYKSWYSINYGRKNRQWIAEPKKCN